MMIIVPVSSVAGQVRGVSYAKGDAIDSPRPGYVMLLRANNITESGLRTDDVVYVPASRVAKKQRLLPGDIVIAASSGSLDVVGKAAQVTKPIDATFGAFCKVVRPSNGVEPAYLASYFRSAGYRRTVSNLAAGANINNLRNEHIDNLELPLPHKNGKPDLDEQKRIAAILDKADDIRRKRQEALRLTDDFIRSVFLDLFGDPVTNPKGWEILSLDELVGGSFRNGLSPSTRGTVEGEVLTLTAITTGTFVVKHVKSALFDRSPSENQRVTRDTFLICRGNGNPQLVGTGVFPTTDLAAVAFPDTMIACTVNRSQIEPLFLQSIWAHPHVRRQIEAGARTTNGTYKVNQTVLGSISFPVPPLSEQTRFSRVARKSLESRKQLDDSAAEAELLFSSLQQRAFRGEL